MFGKGLSLLDQGLLISISLEFNALRPPIVAWLMVTRESSHCVGQNIMQSTCTRIFRKDTCMHALSAEIKIWEKMVKLALITRSNNPARVAQCERVGLMTWWL